MVRLCSDKKMDFFALEIFFKLILPEEILFLILSPALSQCSARGQGFQKSLRSRSPKVQRSLSPSMLIHREFYI